MNYDGMHFRAGTHFDRHGRSASGSAARVGRLPPVPPLPARALVKQLLEIVPEGLRAPDRCEEPVPQGYGLAPLVAPRSPPAPDEVKNQHAEECSDQQQGNPKVQVILCDHDEVGHELLSILHIW